MKEGFVDIAENIVVNNLSMNFYYGEDAYNNFQATKGVFPAAFLSMPIRANAIMRQSGLIEIIFSADILFTNKAKLDGTSIEHLVIQDAMFEKGMAFLKDFIREDSVKSIEPSTKFESFENAFDNNLSGVVLFLEFLSSIPRAIC